MGTQCGVWKGAGLRGKAEETIKSQLGQKERKVMRNEHEKKYVYIELPKCESRGVKAGGG